MIKTIHTLILGTTFFLNSILFAQSDRNCFLADFESKRAEIPPAVNAVKPVEPASAIVTIQNDTIGKISKYVFGNAIAAWAGAHDNPALIEGVALLAPTLIRFPGGSWSNGYFWNGLSADLPDSIYDGTTYNSATKTAKKSKFWGQTGKGGWQTTTDQYYTFREYTDVSEGLITINYGYARYGTSKDPVARAAHLAADWVRYDDGRTKFWEIGNENGGPWEYGWMIDTTLNKDGQPQIITGALYGKHFKVFVDSMKSAAEEIGATIYIGGQVVIDGQSSWNFVDKTWNEGFFQQAGDYADFYVIHNYFSSSNNAKEIINYAVTEIKRDMDFVNRDIQIKKAFLKPLALTEYNIGMGNVNATTNIDGMQAVVLICEMIKNNYGLGARWLLASGENSMFYAGSDPNYLNHPHPDFYYLTYLRKFYGDHAILTVSSNKDILCYASRFASGETGVVIVNKSAADQVIGIDTKSIGVGQNYYIYSFVGGTDNGEFSRNVYINENGPSSAYQWGPYDELPDIKAVSYFIDGAIKLTSPAKSVQMIMIEGGNNHVSAYQESKSEITDSYHLYQNYPNPFNPSTLIRYQLPAKAFVILKVFDVLGGEIETLVEEHQNAGNHSVPFNASNLSSGIYFYRLDDGRNHETRKLLLLK
jgi:hypothetical protein